MRANPGLCGWGPSQETLRRPAEAWPRQGWGRVRFWATPGEAHPGKLRNKVAGDRAAESAQRTRWLRRGSPPTVQVGQGPRRGRGGSWGQWSILTLLAPALPPPSLPLRQEPPHPAAVGADLTLGTRQQEL